MDEMNVLAMCGGVIVLAALGLTVAGPIGMGAIGVVLLAVGITAGSDEASSETPTRNCPNCGAVVEDDVCDYCGRSLSE